MNSRIALLGIVAGVTLLWTLFPATSKLVSAQAEGSASRWEHLAMTVTATDGPGDAETSRRIVQLGDDGWELVDVESIVKDGSNQKLIYFFKRPKQ